MEEPLGRVIDEMLWYFSVWHALGKLRLHSDITAQIFEAVTRKLGQCVRRFQRESAYLDTRELPKEEAARGRREAALAAAKGTSKPGRVSTEKKRKTLNLSTVKWHSLAHYVYDILRLGPTDIYSTQAV